MAVSDWENRLISDRYRVVASVGSGGMANVYKAMDEKTGNLVALKVLKEEHREDADFVRRFEREARAVLALSHPNIVRSFDVGEDGDANYIVFEYVEGNTLKDVIKDEEYLTPKQAVSVMSQILDALEHAHSCGIIHRDVKPQNVMIANDGKAMLTDFGIARDTASTTRTFAGTNVIGSVHYLSPEQARGDHVGPESDIYSCGIMLYEMLTGEVPFAGDNSVAIALKHLQEDVKPPYLINSRIPRALSDVVLKATAKKPELRYQSASAMRADLQRALKEPHGKFARLPKATGEITGGSSQSAVPRRMSIGNIAISILLVLGMFTALFFTVRAMRESKLIESKSFVIPALLGKKMDEAQTLAKLRGFVIEEASRMPSDQYPEGFIINQSPSSGTKSNEGATISVTVSSGSDHVVVPNLVGMTLPAAIELAMENDLQLADPIYMASDKPDGQIISQDPVADTSIFKDDVIEVWVSGQQDLNVDMPQFIGHTLTFALGEVKNLGLTTVRIYPITPESKEAEEESIVRQNPTSGMNVNKNALVELYVCRTFLGSYASDIAFNVDIVEKDRSVVVTAKLDECTEIVLYAATLPVGAQQSVSFTGYLPQGGEYTCIAYVDGEPVRTNPSVFSLR